MDRHKRGSRWPWASIALSIVGFCMFGAAFWIDRSNDAELNRIDAELDRLTRRFDDIQSKLDSPRDDAVTPGQDGTRDSLEKFLRDLDAISPKLGQAKRRQDSPYSADQLLLYAGLLCVLCSVVANLVHVKRRISIRRESGGKPAGGTRGHH